MKILIIVLAIVCLTACSKNENKNMYHETAAGETTASKTTTDETTANETTTASETTVNETTTICETTTGETVDLENNVIFSREIISEEFGVIVVSLVNEKRGEQFYRITIDDVVEMETKVIDELQIVSFAHLILGDFNQDGHEDLAFIPMRFSNDCNGMVVIDLINRCTFPMPQMYAGNDIFEQGDVGVHILMTCQDDNVYISSSQEDFVIMPGYNIEDVLSWQDDDCQNEVLDILEKGQHLGYSTPVDRIETDEEGYLITYQTIIRRGSPLSLGSLKCKLRLEENDYELLNVEYLPPQ